MNPIFLPQGSRMDEQRCSGPQISQNVGTPCSQRNSDASDKPPQRSGSLIRAKTDQHRQVGCHTAQYAAYSFANTSTFLHTCIILSKALK